MPYNFPIPQQGAPAPGPQVPQPQGMGRVMGMPPPAAAQPMGTPPQGAGPGMPPQGMPPPQPAPNQWQQLMQQARAGALRGFGG